MKAIIPKIDDNITINTWNELQTKFCNKVEGDNCMTIACGECMFDLDHVEEFKLYYKKYIGEEDGKNGST